MTNTPHMPGPRVGLVTMLDAREEYYENFRRNSGMDLEQASISVHGMITDALEQSGCEVLSGASVKSQAQSVAAVNELLSGEIEALVVHVPTWSFPSFGASAARQAYVRGVPTLLWGTMALSGPLATRGAIEELGIPFETILGPPGMPHTNRQAVAFARAAAARRRLEGATLGIVGGRSMGINTGTVDTAQLQRVFGIDVDHTDQFEIVRLASQMGEQDVSRHVKYLEEKFAAIGRDDASLTDRTIELSIRSYLATKRIIRDKGYDFIGLKCQPELSDWYANQCISAAFLNDPYDADGPKEPTVCACEADCNGALTMQILKLVSGGKPTLFVDATISPPGESNLIACQNCGGAPTCFASSGNPSDSLGKIRIVPNIQGKAGGPAFAYYAEPRECVTWARLSRSKGEYRMHIIKASMVPIDDQVKGMLPRWPTILLSVETSDVFQFLKSYTSQHIHLVTGDYVDELVEFCKLLEIQCIRV